MMSSLENLPPWLRRLLPWAIAAVIIAVLYTSFNWAVSAMVHNRPTVTVPNITGKTVNEALNLLSQSKLSLLKEGEQFDKKMTAGTVIRQNPPTGMVVREGRAVRIIVSQGGETLYVPDLSGQTLRQAQTLLQNVGLSVGEVDQRPSLRVDKDRVMSTDPPAGAVVGKNALVNLTMSAGAPGGDTLLAPDFVGRSIVEVKSWANTNQVQLSVREESDLSKSNGEILMQAPVADTPIRPGDTLTVVANTGSGAGDVPHVRFEVPGTGDDDRDIRVLVIDEAGEREVFRKAQAPGSVINVPVTVKGRARARIFVNGVMVEQQDLR
jgi:eukaryotic-like serine/threonine-protein kinase